MKKHLAPAASVCGFVLLAACGSTAPRVARSSPPPPSQAPPLEHDSISRSNPAPAKSGTESPSASGAEPVSPPAQGDSTSKGGPLGSVADVPIYAEDLIVEWHQIAGREVSLVVDKVVTTRLAIAEAQRLGMRLAPETVEVRMGIERARLQETVDSFQLGIGVEEYLKNQLGVDPDRYYARMRAATIRQMLAERVVRAWTLSNENVALRLIVTDDVEKMQRVQELLAGGADFGEVAREHSVDDTAPLGGYVPYLVRQEHAPLARLAFSTAVGELGGPVATAEHLFLIRVEERRGAVAGDWRSIESVVEASLDAYGLSDAEFVHWKLAMEARYPIDLRRLEEILGTEG